MSSSHCKAGCLHAHCNSITDTDAAGGVLKRQGLSLSSVGSEAVKCFLDRCDEIPERVVNDEVHPSIPQISMKNGSVE